MALGHRLGAMLLDDGENVLPVDFVAADRGLVGHLLQEGKAPGEAGRESGVRAPLAEGIENYDATGLVASAKDWPAGRARRNDQ